MSTFEGIVLDGLDLNDGTTFTLESVTMPSPAKRPEWQQGADTDGSSLGRTPLFENRTVTARVRVEPQATMDAALATLGTLVDRLQEADRTNTGITLEWTPANSTDTITFTVLTGQITDLPIVVDGDGAGWFVAAPVVTIELTCKPFGTGTETVSTATSSTLPLYTVEIADVPGDVPALGRLIVTDNATQARRHIEWGAESLHYPTSSPPGLILDSDQLTISGFAGTGATETGAFDSAPGTPGGNSVIRASLAAQPSAVCGTGDQPHIGHYRVKARVRAAVNSGSLDIVQVRFTWQDGDGPFRSNRYTTPAVVNGWSEIDLGMITIEPAAAGTQRWSGRIEAMTTEFGSVLDVDMLMLIPTEAGYGVARAEYAYRSGVLTGRDEYTSTTAGAVLNGRVAPAGGTWVTSGATTDFVFADVIQSPVPQPAQETIERTTTGEASSRRIALLGASTTATAEVGLRFFRTARALTGVQPIQVSGVIVRGNTTSDYLAAHVTDNGITGSTTFAITSSSVNLKTVTVSVPVNTWHRIRCVVYGSGLVIAWLLSDNGAEIAKISAIAGAYGSPGKPGILDYNWSTSTINRYYDDFYAATPAAEPIVCNASQSVEFRHDRTIRENAAGTIWGDPPSYRGARFTVPPAGVRNRKTRVAVKARRNDIVANTDDQIADSTTVQIAYVPRYLVVPR